MKTTLWIDGGTTNTRFSVTQGGELLLRQTRHVGAADAQAEHSNKALRSAVAEVLNELAMQYGAIHRICISGMITSASGLIEIPHLQGPAGLAELSQNVRKVHLPELAPPVYCIPGIRFGDADIIRGEETELIGYAATDALFLHFGSHNKAILMQNSRITASCTTLSGELLYAATHDTILRSSLPSQPPETLTREDVLQGAQAAKTQGLPRSLFQVRLLTTLSGWSTARAWSYLYGAVVAQDIVAFEPLLAVRAPETIAYGRHQFAQAFAICLGDRTITQIPYSSSEELSLTGMRRIMDAYDLLQGSAE